MTDTGQHLGLPPAEIVRRIEKALEIDGTHTWDDVRDLLLDGAAQIFWNEHGAWITELLVLPQKRMLNVWVVAGELPEVMALQEQVERFALTQTCDCMIVKGARFGWKDIAKEYGWEEHALVLRHPITGV
jgi:hypothetical protein